jgi:DNA-binding GntR family transcriptional regulator
MCVTAQYLAAGLFAVCLASDNAAMSRTRQDAPTADDDLLTALRSDILSRSLRPGQKLTTELLGRRYDLGPSPLREALSLLVGEGLVVRESGRGFRVSRMSRRDLDDLISSRLLLEPLLLARAIESGGEAWERNILSTLRATSLLCSGIRAWASARATSP